MLPKLNNDQQMTSMEIADLVGSRHDSVKRTIERLYASLAISQPPSVFGEKSANGKKPFHYLIGKRDSYVIVAQLSPEFTGRLVDRWQELEGGCNPALPDFSNPVEAARAWADAKEAEQKALSQLEEAKPKVQVYEMLANRRSDVSTTIVAKEIGTTAIKLNRFLREEGCKMIRIDAPKAGYETWFNVVADSKNGHEFTQCLVTPEGQIEIAKLWGAQ